jgi:hypothetical protein
MERCAKEIGHLGSIRARLDMSLAIGAIPPSHPLGRLGRLHTVGCLFNHCEPTAIVSSLAAKQQLVHWSFAHRLHPHEPPLPPSDHTQSAAMELLDSVLASHRRPDTMRHGVGDLISCAIERLAGSTGESDGHGSKADRDMDGDGQWVGIAQESANLLSRLLTKGMGWSGSTPAEGSSLEGTSSEVSQIDVAS